MGKYDDRVSINDEKNDAVSFEFVQPSTGVFGLPTELQ